MYTATLTGFLGKDIQFKTGNGGMEIASGTIPVNHSIKNEQGEWETKTDWVNFVAFKDSAEYIKNWKQGDLVTILGNIKKDKYVGKDGVEKETQKLNVIQAKLIKAKNKDNVEPKNVNNDDDIPF